MHWFEILIFCNVAAWSELRIGTKKNITDLTTVWSMETTLSIQLVILISCLILQHQLK